MRTHGGRGKEIDDRQWRKSHRFLSQPKQALPRAVRESRDYDSAVRARFLTAQWAVAPIEVADSNPPVDAKNTEVLYRLPYFCFPLWEIRTYGRRPEANKANVSPTKKKNVISHSGREIGIWFFTKQLQNYYLKPRIHSLS